VLASLTNVIVEQTRLGSAALATETSDIPKLENASPGMIAAIIAALRTAIFILFLIIFIIIFLLVYNHRHSRPPIDVHISEKLSYNSP
jgi:hypothetical protein